MMNPNWDESYKNLEFAYGSTLRWTVASVDLGIEEHSKAHPLAAHHGVSINFKVSDFKNLDFDKNTFDAIGLIYIHFPASKTSSIHKTLKYPSEK